MAGVPSTSSSRIAVRRRSVIHYSNSTNLGKSVSMVRDFMWGLRYGQAELGQTSGIPNLVRISVDAHKVVLIGAGVDAISSST